MVLGGFTRHETVFPPANELALVRNRDIRNIIHSKDFRFDFRPNELTHRIARWVFARESMRIENKKIDFMVVRLIDEVFEVLEEIDKLGNAFNRRAYEKEVLDVFFFLISTIANQPHNLLEEIDLPSIANAVNGIGAKDNVYEKMIEIAGNMPDSINIKADFRELLKYWLSYVRHSPMQRGPDVVLTEVLGKNSRNYPEMYFSGRHPKTRELLSEEDCKLQFDHSRTCLRMLRIFCGLPEEGLREDQHLPFAELILDFENAQKNQMILLEILTRLNLESQKAQVLAQYAESNRGNATNSFHQSARLAGVNESTFKRAEQVVIVNLHQVTQYIRELQ